MIKKENKSNKQQKEIKPVIIRREFIVHDDDLEKDNKQKNDKRKNGIGFLDRNQSQGKKDLNIVYRNKKQKPKNISELFGLKKKEEPKVEKSKEKSAEKEVKQTGIKSTQESKQVKKVEAKETTKKEIKKQEEIKTTQKSQDVKTELTSKTDIDILKVNIKSQESAKVEKQNIINKDQEENKTLNTKTTTRQTSSQTNRTNNGTVNYSNNSNNLKNNYNNSNYQNKNTNLNRNSNQNPNQNYNKDTRKFDQRPNQIRNNQNRQNNTGLKQKRPNNYNNANNYNGYDNNNNQYNKQGNFQNNQNTNTFARKPNRPSLAFNNQTRQPNSNYNKQGENFDKVQIQKDYRQNEKKFQNNKPNKFDENKKKKSKNRNEDQEFDSRKIKELKSQTNLTNMYDDQDGGMLDYYDLSTSKAKKNKKAKKQAEEVKESKQKIFQLTEVSIGETISVKDFASALKKTSSEIIKKLFAYGIMATINQEIDFDTAYLVAQEFGITANKIETKTEEDILFDDSEDKEEDLVARPPVVVVMGHVDHGKTSLLDTIKKTNVIEGEAGGITQHIGAYKVKIGDKEITFLDTPGHEAFTAMRARGAQITDIAILIVAANDGVMPQTVEAINHAKAAGIPIIVAINKIDLPDANIEKVKEELMRYELVPEEWGGDTIYVPISAKNNTNIDTLLEMVLLQAEMLELKVNPNKQAKGVVIESRLDKSKGPIATLLVQRGKLDVGDTIVVGQSIGHIRAMTNDKGKKIKSAGPSTPVSITGLSSVPEGGEVFYEVDNEKMAKHLIERRIRQAREKKLKEQNVVTIENFYEKMKEEKYKILNLIIKADVQGSVEALKQSLEKIQNEEVKVKVVHAAAGAVNLSDVTLAKVSNAIIIAFNVRPDAVAQDAAKKDSVEIKQYSVIYQAIDDIENAITGMLAPKYQEKVIGNMEVRDIFKMSTIGTIGGCFVLSGKVERNAGVRVIRENIVIHDGKLSSLKRFKDDAREVSKGFECGITIENYNDLKIGDNIEVYVMEEIKR